MTTQALSVRGLFKRYRDGTEANLDIEMDVSKGEVVSILGPNGAGKTTFLRQVTTELRPTAGSIHVFGEDAVAAPARAKCLMGITPQEAGVFERLTVREHLELFARLKGTRKRDARTAAREVAEELGLGAELTKRVGALSGGQRRRVLVGLALLGRPPLLVLDEPTTGLDPASRRAVWDVIRRARHGGSTVILSTHYIEEAERLSDRVAVILAGRLVAFGTPEELLGRLEKSYRVSYRDPLDPEGEARTRYFASFNEARRHVEGERLSEYSMARASLEDVYFALTGQRIESEELEEEACGV
jgi:ABC-2 type transport system ATP-binding protein